MRRWILGDPRPVVEPKLTVQPEKALRVTKTGQVLSEFKDEVTVAAMNLNRGRALAAARAKFWQAGQKTCLAEVRRLIGLRDPRGKCRVESKGAIQRHGYRIEKLILRREAEVPVPALLFVPSAVEGKGPATLFVDGRGKAREARTGGAVEKLVTAGRIVLSIDARGFGETADRGSKAKYHNHEHRTARLAIHMGRPLLGQRVGDVLAAADVLAARDDVDPHRIDIVGVGPAGPVALHAAALDGRFASLTLRRAIDSWVDDVLAKPLGRDLMGYIVPGALMTYDLPDLIRVVAPGER
jgi:hypothetical protein